MTQEEIIEFNMLILKAFIDNYLPLSLFDSVSFKKAYLYLNRSATLWCRQTAANFLKVLYNSSKLKLNKRIQNLKSKISISTDLWTAINSCTFCAITIHFINEDWVAENYLLDFVDFPYPHTSEDIKSLILKVINDHLLSSKLLTITHDNAGNVVNSSREITKILHETHQNECYNIRCLAHTINIIVKAGLTLLSPHLDKVHEFVRKLHTSPKFLQQFQEIAGCIIPLDVCTRWNSTYLMLSIVNKNYLKINLQCNLTEGIQISNEEFETLKKIENFLLPFYNTTKLISANSTPTVGMALLFMNDLLETIDNKIAMNELLFKEACGAMRAKCIKYKNDYETFNFYVAGYLDPRIKKSVLPPTINTPANYEKFKALHASYVDIFSFPEETLFEDDHTTNLLTRLRNETQQLRVNSDELADYEMEPPLKGNTVLEWWKVNGPRFPALSKMAKDFLAQASTSVPSERMFSLAGNIVTAKRNRLQTSTVTNIMCIKSWESLPE